MATSPSSADAPEKGATQLERDPASPRTYAQNATEERTVSDVCPLKSVRQREELDFQIIKQQRFADQEFRKRQRAEFEERQQKLHDQKINQKHRATTKTMVNPRLMNS